MLSAEQPFSKWDVKSKVAARLASVASLRNTVRNASRLADQLGIEQINVRLATAVLPESAPSSQTEVRELFRMAQFREHEPACLDCRVVLGIIPFGG